MSFFTATEQRLWDKDVHLGINQRLESVFLRLKKEKSDEHEQGKRGQANESERDGNRENVYSQTNTKTFIVE